MPTIYLPKKKKKNYKKHSDKQNFISTLYNSQKWQKLRNSYIMEHPLCERCLNNGVVNIATEVHHIKPISTGLNKIEMTELCYNGELMALCTQCHHEIHKELNKKVQLIILD